MCVFPILRVDKFVDIYRPQLYIKGVSLYDNIAADILCLCGNFMSRLCMTAFAGISPAIFFLFLEPKLISDDMFMYQWRITLFINGWAPRNLTILTLSHSVKNYHFI